MRERPCARVRARGQRYTLTYSEGTLSIYAAFSRSKYLIVQFAQKPFVILVTYLICRKISFVNKKIVKNIKKIYFVYPTLHIQNPESIFAINTNLFITIRINNIIQAENFHISKNSSSIFSLVKTIQIMHRNSHNASFK